MEISARETVTDAEPDLVGSATLVAVTVTLPPVTGVVSVAEFPLPLMVPADAVHVTAELEEPLTVALKATVPPASAVALDGDMATLTAVTVTDAEAFLVASSTLVAVTVKFPPLIGAVKVRLLPEPVSVPPDEVHVTSLVAPLATVAVKSWVPPPCSVAVVGEMETVTGSGGSVDLSEPPHAASAIRASEAMEWRSGNREGACRGTVKAVCVLTFGPRGVWGLYLGTCQRNKEREKSPGTSSRADQLV